MAEAEGKTFNPANAMTIQDILDAAKAEGRSSTFLRALATVLPNECESLPDGKTIRSERPDSHGLTFAGLNQQDDALPVDPSGNVTASASWIEHTYFLLYWKACRCDSRPSPLCILVFVQAVNQGSGEGIRLLQYALNDYGAHLTIDGKIGDQTCKAAMACPDSNGLALAFLAKSRAYYNQITSAHPNDLKFLQGWLNRINDLQTKFCSDPLQVATTATPPQPPLAADGLVITTDILNS
jgi:hypothetical protein